MFEKLDQALARLRSSPCDAAPSRASGQLNLELTLGLSSSFPSQHGFEGSADERMQAHRNEIAGKGIGTGSDATDDTVSHNTLAFV
jgi:hypothetical protein